MGHCSNRAESYDEKISRYAEEVQRNASNVHTSDWQCSKGAEIRGTMGVEKGNQFIADMKKYG